MSEATRMSITGTTGTHLSVSRATHSSKSKSRSRSSSTASSHSEPEAGVTKPKATKSRNGCVTCKAKRLKCDETKPTCQQCEKRGVECGGYKRNFKWKAFDESSFVDQPGYAKAKDMPAVNDRPLSASPTATAATSPSPPQIRYSFHGGNIAERSIHQTTNSEIRSPVGQYSGASSTLMPFTEPIGGIDELAAPQVLAHPGQTPQDGPAETASYSSYLTSNIDFDQSMLQAMMGQDLSSPIDPSAVDFSQTPGSYLMPATALAPMPYEAPSFGTPISQPHQSLYSAPQHVIAPVSQAELQRQWMINQSNAQVYMDDPAFQQEMTETFLSGQQEDLHPNQFRSDPRSRQPSRRS